MAWRSPSSATMMLAFAVTFALAGCNSSSDSDGERVEELTAKQVVTDAATAMSTVESASFTIEQTGATVFIDDAEQFAFQAADGRFAAPGSSEAILTVQALGFVTEVGAIAIDGRLWLTNPLTGEWGEAPENFTFDPAQLFNADTGIPALLREATATAELVDDLADQSTGESSDEADSDRGNVHLVRTLVSAERVAVLTSGLVNEESEVDLRIDATSDRIVEVSFDVDVDGAVSDWRMTLSDYDEDVTIDPPELNAGG
ncbi:MAG: LppX_LprAFG lipoprotein [Acidimicrobiia bacterium]|nr:LppX_LprAFG lipoprotein [Acidimicrobiia bacterium]